MQIPYMSSDSSENNSEEEIMEESKNRNEILKKPMPNIKKCSVCRATMKINEVYREIIHLEGRSICTATVVICPNCDIELEYHNRENEKLLHPYGCSVWSSRFKKYAFEDDF